MDYCNVIEKIRKSIGIVYMVQGQNKIISKGSGFIFFKKGILVTCNHVIAKQDSNVLIQFSDKQELLFQAKVMM